MPPRTKTIAELRRELRAREKQLTILRARRNKILAKVAKIDREIAVVSGDLRLRGGKAAPVRRGRPGRPGRPAGRKGGARGKPLVQYAQEVLKKAGKPMRVKDVVTAVTAAGYRSASKDFYGIVATTLRDKKKFHLVKRGVYTLA